LFSYHRSNWDFYLSSIFLFYWEIFADNLKKRGWSLGWVSAVDSQGQTIWIVDPHRDDGKRFVVHAGEKLTVFLELESAVRATSAVHPTKSTDHPSSFPQPS
jgi:predicted nicotinamide N-methyase